MKIFVRITEGIEPPGNPFYILSSYKKAFYFEQPDKNTIYYAVGSTLQFSSDDNSGFLTVQDQVSNISLEFENGSHELKDFPVVFGGMKFPGSTDNNSNDWNDYKDSDWFIPAYLFLIKESRSYLISFSKEKPNAKNAVEKFLNKWNAKKEYSAELPEAHLIKHILKYKWHLLVDNAVAEIKKGTFSKIVLSRKVDLSINGEIDFNRVISSLREPYKSCTLFIFKSKDSYFFGATPEKAVSVKNGIAEFDALAGSAPRGIDKLTDSRYEKYLLNSTKDRDEHNFVIEYIKNESSELVKEFSVSETVVKKLNNIQHLFTGITAEIKEPTLMFSLLNRVIPTPAVCGLPKESALEFINEYEGYTRGLYSGTIGWFNLNCEGEFMAALRSALYKKNKLSIFAGCGIIEDSDPAKEYEETELKLQPIMSIFL